MLDPSGSMITHLVTPSDYDRVTDLLNEFAYTLAPGLGPLNAGPFFASANNVGFRTPDHNGYVLFSHVGNHGDGAVYDGHLLCRPKSGAIALGRAGVAMMFTHWRASAIAALIPKTNRASRIAFRAIGGTPIGESDDNLGRPCIAYMLERGPWEKSLVRSLA